MPTLTSEGTVRKIFVDGSRTFVSFFEHDGYFEIIAPDHRLHIDHAKSSDKTLRFQHDENLKILYIEDT